eukprot:scaffold294658_cov33-Tisochrysis_lutea.AAC.4
MVVEPVDDDGRGALFGSRRTQWQQAWRLVEPETAQNPSSRPVPLQQVAGLVADEEACGLPPRRDAQ